MRKRFLAMSVPIASFAWLLSTLAPIHGVAQTVLPEKVSTPADARAHGLESLRKAIAADGGWLYVGHEACEVAGARRYTHRLVWLDAAFRIARVSDPFFFLHQGIEFCAGLARIGEDLVFSFGVADQRACVARIPESSVLAWLSAPAARTYPRSVRCPAMP